MNRTTQKPVVNIKQRKQARAQHSPWQMGRAHSLILGNPNSVRSSALWRVWKCSVYSLEKGQAGIEVTPVETLKVEVLCPKSLRIQGEFTQKCYFFTFSQCTFPTLTAALHVFFPILQLSLPKSFFQYSMNRLLLQVELRPLQRCVRALNPQWMWMQIHTSACELLWK